MFVVSPCSNQQPAPASTAHLSSHRTHLHCCNVHCCCFRAVAVLTKGVSASLLAAVADVNAGMIAVLRSVFVLLLFALCSCCQLLCSHVTACRGALPGLGLCTAVHMQQTEATAAEAGVSGERTGTEDNYSHQPRHQRLRAQIQCSRNTMCHLMYLHSHLEYVPVPVGCMYH